MLAQTNFNDNNIKPFFFCSCFIFVLFGLFFVLFCFFLLFLLFFVVLQSCKNMAGKIYSKVRRSK